VPLSKDIDMPTAEMPAAGPYPDVPFTPLFHPEVGYLCPSASLRRKVRRAAMTTVAGMVIAASTALALVAPMPALDGGRDQPPPSAVSGWQPIDDPMPVTDARSVTAAPPLPVTGFSGPSRAQASCEDLSRSFLVAKCRFGRTGKAGVAHTSRAVIHRIATVPSDPEPLSEPHKAAAGRMAQAAAATAAQAAAASNETPTKLAKSAVPAKPPVKAAPKRDRRPSQEAEPASAAAAAPGNGDSRGLVFPRLVIPSLFGGADWARSR